MKRRKDALGMSKSKMSGLINSYGPGMTVHKSSHKGQETSLKIKETKIQAPPMPLTLAKFTNFSEFSHL